MCTYWQSEGARKEILQEYASNIFLIVCKVYCLSLRLRKKMYEAQLSPSSCHYTYSQIPASPSSHAPSPSTTQGPRRDRVLAAIRFETDRQEEPVAAMTALCRSLPGRPGYSLEPHTPCAPTQQCPELALGSE